MSEVKRDAATDLAMCEAIDDGLLVDKILEAARAIKSREVLSHWIWRAQAAEAELTQLREPVRWFAKQMEETLRRNDHKGGWETCGPEYLIVRLHEELHELTQAIHRSGSYSWIISEATDVANFAMMIADLARKNKL